MLFNICMNKIIFKIRRLKYKFNNTIKTKESYNPKKYLEYL